MKKVKSVQYNWHLSGNSENGMGEDYYKYEMGVKGVKEIDENEPHNGMQLWNYVIRLDNGSSFRVFHPNIVEYYPL